MPTIQSLHWYPVKSCAGLSVEQLRFGKSGPCHDRSWMLVDDDARYLTARTLPHMLRLLPVVRDGLLLLRVPVEGSAPELLELAALDTDAPANPVLLEPRSLSKQRLEVSIWGDSCAAVVADDTVNTILSNFLGTSVRLVFMAADTVRPVEQDYIDRTALAGQTFQVGFADAYQALVIGQASLDILNQKMAQALPMSRFRPNIVVSGSEPFAEDSWHRIESDGVVLYGVKKCSRCAITTVDPDTGSRGKEPLKTLATFRRGERGIMFGQNLVYSTPYEDGRTQTLVCGAELNVVSHLPDSGEGY
ncbi:MOSC domain-containing protein [Allohahella marinimesophila]|uniref:MOSC domain-containing protein n=1 Tax=Allohahella marinimesophila TaxID=1054972 RepID=A0ABP7QAU3_9GAMM